MAPICISINISYQCFFLITEAKSVFIFVDTGSLLNMTMHQLPAEHYIGLKLIFLLQPSFLL